ncbi:MAG: Fic family protein [Spirochaetes bacterium]|nr:Fic family protein [Spirochaetota bacterium]
MSELLYQINPNRNVPWDNIPPLPIREELWQTTEILQKLGDAKAALGKLQGRSVVIPNQGLLINTITLQEAKISSEIEHIFTTDDELYKAYSDKNTASEGASKEVLRYREALWSGYNYLQNAKKFDTNYFIRVFQEIRQTKDTVRPAYVQLTVKQGGSGPNAGQVIYTPPRNVTIVQDRLDNLVNFANDDLEFKIDPLLKMAIAHFQFEAIHPFRDGNGRTGRVFNINFLTNKGLLDLPILFLSRYILDHKDDYYSGLMGVSQRGDWKNWLLFMLIAVENTSIQTFNKINDIVAAKDSILVYLKKEDKKLRNPDDLVEFLFNQPFTKVKHLTDAKLYAENTARDYLNKLCKLRVLEKKEIEGHHYYLNLELYRILSE